MYLVYFIFLFYYSQVGKLENATGDDGGHLIASALGGAGDRINLVPMQSVLNHGDYKAMEKYFLDKLRDEKSVPVKIEIKYPNSSSLRPHQFLVYANINGQQRVFTFDQ